MIKTIHDLQLKEFIEKLKSLKSDWYWDDIDYGRRALQCAGELGEIIDWYLNQSEPEVITRSFPVEEEECDYGCANCIYEGTQCDRIIMPFDIEIGDKDD